MLNNHPTIRATSPAQHLSFSDFLFILMSVKFLIPGDNSQGVNHTCPGQRPGLTLEASECNSECVPSAGVGRLLSRVPKMDISQGDLRNKGRMW